MALPYIRIEHRATEVNGMPMSEYRACIGSPVGPWRMAESTARRDMAACITNVWSVPLVAAR